MRKYLTYILALFIILAAIFSKNILVFAQTMVKGAPVITTVGTPGGSPPGTPPPGTPSPSLPPGGGGPLGLTVSCPLGSDFKITCGTQANPVGGCGHGGAGYGPCSAPPYAVCPYSSQLIHALDVALPSGNAANAPVYFPYIDGNQPIGWVLVSGPIPINGGSWGYKAEFTANYNGKTLRLDLTHLNPVVKSAGSSGDQVGGVYSGTDGPGAGHLHTAISVDGTWVEAEKEAFMCANASP